MENLDKSMQIWAKFWRRYEKNFFATYGIPHRQRSHKNYAKFGNVIQKRFF